MDAASSQVTILVTSGGQTVKTISLDSGAIVAGRDGSCELHLDDRKISRRHCEIRVDAGRVAVIDLGSRNGSRLGETQLPPGKARTWTAGVPLNIGPFALLLSSDAPASPPPAEPPARRVPAAPAAPSDLRSRRIACGLAEPSVVTLRAQPITVGRDKKCDMVLDDSRISRRQCEIRQEGGLVWVKDLSGRGSTQVGKQALPGGGRQVWPEGELLHLGPFSLVQSVDTSSPAAVRGAPTSATLEPGLAPGLEVGSGIGARMWLGWLQQLPWVPIAFVVGGLCLVGGVGVGAYRMLRPDDDIVVAPTPTAPVAETTAVATPDAVPSSTPVPTGLSETAMWLPSATPLPTVPCTPQTAGWLNLPFPYDGRNKGFGSAEQFREISQRAASGGRITSFFDHQYPLYKREAEYEGSRIRDTLIIFDGSRSLNKWDYPDQTGDYYSGHPGIDFGPYEWGKATTPLLAPADGAFVAAGTDRYGNNYVLIKHDRGEDGLYQTSYLHLHRDDHFRRMLDLEPGTPIQEGERIGTIGNTGNSTGHHLHFEVQRDCDGDEKFGREERVDPYGFIPSTDIRTDPMSDLACGPSQYLWKYTLDPDEEGGGCAQPERRWQLDPAPFQGFVSVATFIFSTADPSTPTRVRVWLPDSDAEKVYPKSIAVYRYVVEAATGAGNWEVVPDSEVVLAEGNVYVEVYLNVPGKYTVTGKPRKDIIPPSTTIKLSGPQQDGKFVGDVTVEFTWDDQGGEGVREINYSLDCGQTWDVYADRPFILERDELAPCRRADDPQGDEQGLQEDEYMILAASVDWADNYEQPPAQLRFRLVAAGDTG